MISEEDFDAVADPLPDMAFVRLERKFRAAYEANLQNSDGDGSYRHYTAEYMAHVVAAAQALGLPLLSGYELPINDDVNLHDNYKSFRQQVDAFTVRVQIAHIRSGTRNTVALDESEKKHLRAYADAIKSVIDKSTLIQAKKDRLYDKINAFIAELDRERMPLQKFHDVVMSLATTGAEAADKLEPAWKWVRLGAELLGARQETEQQKLPLPQKKIEAPKRKLEAPKEVNGKRNDMDDEIPF